MADDIKLVIGVEQSALLKAITNTETLQGKVKKLSAAYSKQNATYKQYNKAVGDLAKSTNRNKKELLSYGTALRADEKATQRATAKVKALSLARKQAAKDAKIKAAAERVAVKATEDLARAEVKNAASLKTMRMATDGVYRNQQKRLQMKKLLKSAIVAETMTTEQAIAALKRYNATQMSSNRVMGASKNKMNGNNMAIQQLGYQFGDFAVQVQGGTSAFVAFSQQGAQLAGILPMVAGPLGLSMGAAVGLSAALGILIPVGSAVGRMFFEMAGSAKTLSGAFDSLGPLNDALDGFGSNFGVSLMGNISEIRAEFGNLVADVYQAEVLAMQKSIQGTFKRGFLQESFAESYAATSINSAVHSGNDTPKALEFRASQVLQIQKALNILYSEEVQSKSQLAELFRESYNDLVASGAVNKRGLKVLRETANANGIILDTIKTTKDETKTRTDLEEAAAKRLKKLNADRWSAFVSQHKDSLSFIEDRARAEELAAAKSKSVVEQQERYLKVSKDDLLVQKLKGEVLASYNSAGEKTLDTLAKEVSLAGTVARIKAEQKFIAGGITQEEQSQIDKLVLAATEAELLNQKIAAGAENANSLADALNRAAGAMSALSNFGDGIEKALSVAVAQTKAMVAGANAANAGRVAGMRFDAQAKYDKAVTMSGLTGESSIRVAAQQEFESQTSNINSLEGQLGTQSGIKESRKTKKSGGSGDKINAFEKLTVELARRKDLLNMSEAQATVTKGIWKLEDALGKDRAKYSAAELKAIVQKGIALSETEKAAEEAIAQQQAFADTLESSMSDAFTSMVDGTKSFKDAMKDMARSVIKQLFEVLVVQRMVGSFDAKSKTGSGLVGAVMGAFQADGGAWQGGSQVQAYANGGVVNGPTTFGMSGGKTGLMGEAGPEAIMPLKRGSNGKLGVQMEGGGGGDTIVVHQNFNFQSNGDDSIKKLIAQAAPQISAMTKSSLLNDRRRGGATKAAFG